MRRQEPLLRKAAWLEGWIFTVSSLACLLLANRSATFAVLLALPGYAVMLAGYYFLSRSPSWFWVTAISTASIGTSILISLSEVSDPAISTAVLPLVGNGLAALSIMLHETTSGRVYLVLLFLATLGFTLPLQTPEGAVQLAAIILVAWVVNIGGAIWLSAAITSARARIARIGIAHQAERRASELEATRRRSARLLHDTVLATLTLLAHSGVGVDPQALRVQAAQDAILLRQLRLGETPSPRSSGTYMLQPDEVTAAAQSVRALRQRFARRGLTVHWHGDGDIILPHATRTAFMLSLGECLENVSRHAGVDAADVTVTQNEIGVRAMVTDAGVGFDTNDVDTARLGIAESVMARIRDVGGNARIFSAPGAGTTVVMEVPPVTPFRDTADHSESIEQLRQQTQTTLTTGDSPVPVGSSLGVVMGVTATVLSLRGLLVFLTNWSDYSAPWLTLLGWMLVGLTLLTATAAARANGTTLSTPGFVVTLTALAAAILIDVSSTGGFTTDQPDLTVIVGASAAMLPLAVFRSARQLIASMLVLTAVLFVILTLDRFTFEPQSHPQIEVVVAAVGPPLLGLLILNAFRRFVDQELSRNLNRTAKATVSKSKTEPTGSSSIDDLTRLDTEAEQLLSDVATGRLPLPLTSEQASAASALAKDLRRRLVAGRQQSWLQHAVHDSKALRPHVSVIDPANLAVLLDPGQREGLLSAIWLLAAPSGRSTPSIRLSMGPETQAIQIERDDKLRFSIDMSIDAVPRRRFDVTVMSSLGRVGSHVETGRRGSIHIHIDCLTDTPEP